MKYCMAAKIPDQNRKGDLTRFAQEVWAKSCYITDAEGLQHEVIHTGDLQDLIREWLGWAD